ncbi:hypothetical protein J1605_014021 [Eschrichtius robustus]|uniref:Chemokine-like factor n=1 Tax=Eschrichtius robustus TaxID=9764 RepID=A0AB34GE06_ESCRO|nr:hypothetical protein J1605_014021 [Eschrichtius robustus]
MGPGTLGEGGSFRSLEGSPARDKSWARSPKTPPAPCRLASGTPASDRPAPPPRPPEEIPAPRRRGFGFRLVPRAKGAEWDRGPPPGRQRGELRDALPRGQAQRCAPSDPGLEAGLRGLSRRSAREAQLRSGRSNIAPQANPADPTFLAAHFGASAAQRLGPPPRTASSPAPAPPCRLLKRHRLISPSLREDEMLTVKLKPKHRPFCFSVKGHVKMLRLALTVTSMTLFIIAQAPEPYIVVTGFEDIINSVVTAVFMIVISVLALIPETTTYIVIGGVFGLVASVFCIADGALIYRKLLFNPSGPYQKSAVHDKL